MTITPEMLAAYADGELDHDDVERVEMAMAGYPQLAAEAAAHRALRARLTAHYGPILLEPLPDRLLPPVKETASVLDFAAAKEVRERRRSLVARSVWPVGGAIAAMLVLGVTFGGGLLSGGGLPQSTIAALDSQPSGAAGETRVLLSFVDQSGDYCRVYAEGAASGIACRADGAWDVRWSGQGGAAQGSEMRQAGSAAAFAEAQLMSAGEALDAEQERAAMAGGWVRGE